MVYCDQLHPWQIDGRYELMSSQICLDLIFLRGVVWPTAHMTNQISLDHFTEEGGNLRQVKSV